MSRAFRALAYAAAGSILAGCQVFCIHDCYSSGRPTAPLSAAPAPAPGGRTTVTVIPANADGHIGTVVVDPDNTRTVLNTAYASARVDQGMPAAAYTASGDDVQAVYRDLLSSRPLPPVSFTAYFDFGTDRLSEEAAGIIVQLHSEIGKRSNSEITVIGHTDRSGNEERNDALALRRATGVRRQLIRLGIPQALITVAARGEREPLVETEDGVAEPRNRRVEISIR